MRIKFVTAPSSFLIQNFRCLAATEHISYGVRDLAALLFRMYSSISFYSFSLINPNFCGVGSGAERLPLTVYRVLTLKIPRLKAAEF
jgi:hypothetical protein